MVITRGKLNRFERFAVAAPESEVRGASRQMSNLVSVLCDDQADTTDMEMNFARTRSNSSRHTRFSLATCH